jgi:tetratricopeptide (TPR) repeat protein
MRRQLHLIVLTGGLLWLLLGTAGCGGRASFSAEVDEPYYRQGDRLKKQGRPHEALSAFLRVIEKRGDAAPESHLEAGLLYQQYLKDPIAAIYHFRRYIELQPNSRQAELVRSRIDAATREFARSLPAQPLEGQAARFETLARIDALQKENLQLKEEIAALHQGAASAGAEARRALGTAPMESPPSPARLSPFTRPTTSPATAPVRTVQSARPPSTPPANPPPASGRRHVVASGDTLYRIAQRYYGSGAKWPEILEANRHQLTSENSVRPGMELRIP